MWSRDTLFDTMFAVLNCKARVKGKHWSRVENRREGRMVYRCSSEKSSINNTLRSKQDRLYTSARQTTLTIFLFVNIVFIWASPFFQAKRALRNICKTAREHCKREMMEDKSSDFPGSSWRPQLRSERTELENNVVPVTWNRNNEHAL